MKEMTKQYTVASCIAGLSFVTVAFSFKFLIDARLFTHGLQALPFIFLLVFLPCFLAGIIRSWIRIGKTTVEKRYEMDGMKIVVKDVIKRHKLGAVEIEVKATVLAVMLASSLALAGGILLGSLEHGYQRIYYLSVDRQYEDDGRDAPVLEAMERVDLHAIIPGLPAGMDVFPPFSWENETGLRYVPRIYNISYFANISFHDAPVNVSGLLQGIVDGGPFVYGTSYPYFEGYDAVEYDAADLGDARIWTAGNGTWYQESPTGNFTTTVTWLASVHYQHYSIWSEIDITPQELLIIDVILGTNASGEPILVACLPPFLPWTFF